MNEPHITFVGTVVADPKYAVTKGGLPVLSLRVVTTPRRFDRGSGEWRDGEPMFLSVTCWRRLAENAGESVRRGDPVVVTGRLQMRHYEDAEGVRRMAVAIDATALGHDLTRGTAEFRRAQRQFAESAEDRQVAQRLAEEWAVPVTPDHAGDAVDPTGAEDGGAAHDDADRRAA